MVPVAIERVVLDHLQHHNHITRFHIGLNGGGGGEENKNLPHPAKKFTINFASKRNPDEKF